MLHIAAGLALLSAIGAILLGITGGRRGKRAQYYAIRRRAHEESGRRMAFGFWSLVFAGLLYGLSMFLSQDLAASDVAPTALETAAPVLTPSDVQATDPVAEPTQAVMVVSPTEIALPTPEPSATPVASLPTPTLAAPTITPAATVRGESAKPTAVANANAGTPFSPSASQALALRAIGTGWGKSGELQGVATEFATGTKTITVFYNFQDVTKGSLLRHTWLKDGKTLSFSSVTFSKPGKGTDGISWSPRGGFVPGLYEVRVALGSTQQFVANFLVR